MPEYFCYKCQRTINIEGDLRCPVCHDEFIEEIRAHEPANMHAMGDDDDDDGPTIGIEDFLRILSNQHRSGQNPSASSSRGANTQPTGSRGAGIFGQLFSNIMQSNTSPSPQPSRSNEPPPRNENSQNAGPQEQGFMEFMNQLLANLNANASGNGATIHFHFGNGPPISSNINNYVFGDGAFDQLISHLLNHAEVQQQGLSEEDMENLPKVEIGQEKVDNSVNCTTCMENFVLNEEVVELPCKHVFHRDCIFPWLKKQNTCPICRNEVPHSKKKQTEITDIDDLD